MKTIFTSAIGGSMGMLLVSMGYSITTWQFWVIFLLMFLYALNLAE